MVPVKHGMSALMIVLKEEEIKERDIPLHVYQVKIAT